MRTALRNSDEVFHYWANKIQSEGRAGNVFFRDSKVYSYGAHFCIARHLPIGAVAMTTRSHSSSTSRHVSDARSAARHLHIVYCNDPSDSAHQNMAHARNEIRDALADAEKPRIRQTTRDAHKGRALRIAEQANAYLAALPADERGALEPIDTSALESVRAALIASEEAAQRIREEQQRQRVGDLLESLAKWRTGEVIQRTGLYAIPCALRLAYREQYMGEAGYQTIQTSHGAEIPASHARRLWPVIQRARESGTEWNSPPQKSLSVGVYTLRTIRADGSIVVGCHDIPYAEIALMAVAMGLCEQANTLHNASEALAS